VTPGSVDDVLGYAHSMTSSRFAMGMLSNEEDVGKIHRFVGEHGAVAQNLYTGSFLVVPDASAPATKKAPLTKDSAVHGDRVRSYFVGLGLPSEQIKNVRPHALVSGGGPVEVVSKKLDEHGTLVAYYSVLQRSIGGFDVPDSYAWARFNADDEVVEEAVYWPPIEAAVLDRAKQLSDLVTDSKSRSALLASIAQKSPVPLDWATVQVAIHLPFATAQSGALEAFASVDVRSQRNGGKVTTYHFDAAGAELFQPVPWLSATTEKR